MLQDICGKAFLEASQLVPQQLHNNYGTLIMTIQHHFQTSKLLEDGTSQRLNNIKEIPRFAGQVQTKTTIDINKINYLRNFYQTQSLILASIIIIFLTLLEQRTYIFVWRFYIYFQLIKTISHEEYSYSCGFSLCLDSANKLHFRC